METDSSHPNVYWCARCYQWHAVALVFNGTKVFPCPQAEALGFEPLVVW